MSFDDLNNPNMDDLKTPEFLNWVSRQYPEGKIIPEKQDFDPNVYAKTDKERASQYRVAQAARLIQLYREWKATQN